MKKKKNVNTNVENYSHIATIESPLSVSAEAYRRVKVALEYSDVDRKIQVIQVCSALQGEGKTTTALNLAAAYAENGKKVIVVDMDFRRAKLHRVFKVENKNGLIDVVAKKIELKDAIKSKEGFNFNLINRGTKTPYPSAILSSNELVKVVEELRTMYDYVLIDCPPVLAVSDAIAISKLTDGCIFVVSNKITEKAAAKEAIKALKANKVNLLGCVVTGLNKKSKDYYSGKYQYYFQSYNSDKK